MKKALLKGRNKYDRYSSKKKKQEEEEKIPENIFKLG